ncbi:MAG: 1-acyl-sn-glycerol-3-phosphate acyltransferase [Planctomycetota bacterium]|nr:1-acyl-sn-glycerol-3-phosphate acyltransferase [Planctomycetota bacterium]
MSPFALIAGSVLLLLLPRLVLPGRQPRLEGRNYQRLRSHLRMIFRIWSAPKPEMPLHLRPLWWINQLYCGVWHQLQVENEPPLPDTGPAILVANHTCGIDHLILQCGTRRVLGFMVAQEFYDYWVYHPFCVAIGCIPVKRDGRDQTAIRTALRVLKEGRVLPIFPEGRINPTSGREFLDAKPGAAFIALRSGVPVIPAYIRGTPPTNEIGASLTTPSRARLVFGPPIDLSDLTGPDVGHDRERINLAEATERIMSALRALRDQSGIPCPEAQLASP